MKYRVISFNIKCDDTIVELSGPFEWENRRAELVKNIQEFDADILSLQEVMPHQYQYLCQKLCDKYQSTFVCRDDNAKNGEGCPIFFKKDKFDLEFANTFWLSETPDVPASTSWNTRWPRICTFVILQDKLSNQRFAVFNTHLDHKSEDARVNGIKLICKKIIEIDLPTVLTGDFNSPRNLNAVSFASKTLTNANTLNNQDITFHLFGKPEILDPSIRYIDYIFCKKFKPSNYQVHNQKPQYNIISDHYAISSEIEY